jgi:hypothetical protein
MTSDDYLGLPSPWYFERIVEGYANWELPRDVLGAALRSTREELTGRGVTEFRPDGRKRLRPDRLRIRATELREQVTGRCSRRTQNR